MDGLQGDVTMVVDESLDCPEYNKDNFQMAEEFSFWVEGVFQVRNMDSRNIYLKSSFIFKAQRSSVDSIWWYFS